MSPRVEGALEFCRYLEVVRVVGVRHQDAVVGALQQEAVCDASVGVAVAAEVGQTFVVAQLLEVLVVLGHASVAQVFHHTWRTHFTKETNTPPPCIMRSINE